MFSNVGLPELVVIVMAALFILGPERLPSAAAWLGKSVRQVREYATGARQQLEDELGPEFDELRKPLSELQQLRGLNPRTALTKHLFDSGTPDSDAPDDAPNPSDQRVPTAPVKPKTFDPVNMAKPLAADERPPFDSDAT